MKIVDDLKIFSLFAYSAYRKEYIPFKYFKKKEHQQLFKRAITEYEIDIFIDDFIILPISRSHHVDFLVRLVANKFNAPFFYCFEYSRNVAKNCGLNSRERYYNLLNVLTVKNLPPDYYYVLFDDIVTSGATMLEMYRALLAHGVPKSQICGMAFFNSAK